ncbi:tRNA uridine-5-carboxymethylaminomethyl(34) synthesis GTPase MnmE [Mycoplasma phocimorsus]|uniref:tRNA uridine-5-carboxymethylaminomethyl(34) synthesis GTPase MnmE n=1 Tax=Mycoplasma phocimorsus TaxID=3045839 RepID=UPI0024BFBD6D|nr:tRNA uridine-5-carboxymethylaminomethyl(34) synthesis GTPase MnmE [Mycoplasma phocimorsus]MDJ1646320.1 tRNA uridine-5-carboxymethylaminomethyl(34) synthesis GTPase MnmE [Mycoplasma phocimorsus]
MFIDTIAAISSGAKVNQPIGIVRMSGTDSISILKKIFKGHIPPFDTNKKFIQYGYIYDGDKLVDEVLVMIYYANQTYTGETMIEINCHGGIVVSNWILELLLANGARLAKNGEFTQRAFLNGKIDLTKADAIHDMIFAKTKSQVELSANKFLMKTFNYLEKIIHELEFYIANLEANIDYPEYLDIEDINNEKFMHALIEISKKLEKMIQKSQRNIKIFEGIKIVILGKPNVGKSSLLNALIKEEKAIVTDIEGTTTDLIETSIQIDNILFKIIDTAGIRQAKNKIEKIGIEKGLKYLESADIIIHLIDDRAENEYDNQIVEKAKEFNIKYIKVKNKSDINFEQGIINISALNNDINDLEKILINDYKDIDYSSEDSTNNIRQLSLIRQAKASIDESIQALEDGMTPDIVIIDVNKAWESLKEITGDVNREDLLDALFKNFCLGK